MPSPVVAHLVAVTPETELRAMQRESKAQRETIQARADLELARADLELAQITEALELKTRRATPKPSQRSSRSAARPGATQKRILDAVARLPQPVSPAEIIADMDAHGGAGNPGTIHNAIGRLVKIGALHKLDVGQYQLASRNGSLAESNAGPTENGANQPPFPAGDLQDAS